MKCKRYLLVLLVMLFPVVTDAVSASTKSINISRSEMDAIAATIDELTSNRDQVDRFLGEGNKFQEIDVVFLGRISSHQVQDIQAALRNQRITLHPSRDKSKLLSSLRLGTWKEFIFYTEVIDRGKVKVVLLGDGFEIYFLVKKNGNAFDVEWPETLDLHTGVRL